MNFSVKKTLPGSFARTGELTTAHGQIQTPVFMPVGTYGAVRGLLPEELNELGTEIILGNTYHLHLRPGEELIAKHGGLQRWSAWDKPILTDSGGYQAYSLGSTRLNSAKTTDDGVTFASHIDGKKLKFTPENVLDIQAKLGSDIAMVLDDCPPIAADKLLIGHQAPNIEATKERVADAVQRTTEWARRSIDHWKGGDIFPRDRSSAPAASSLNSSPGFSLVGESQATGLRMSLRKNTPASKAGLFGIIQGGLHQDLREQSAREIQALPFDGIAVGGVAIESEGKVLMNKAVDYVAGLLDKARPHYLMGVGEPVDLIRMIDKGMDMFDCVIPTRYARHGSFWLTKDFSRQNIAAAKFTDDDAPLDPDCSCKTCQTFSRSYLRHLYLANEINSARALSYHNLHILFQLVRDIRQAIEDGTFSRKYAAYLKG